MRRQLAARTVAKGVDAVGLTKPAFRFRERVRARRAGDGPSIGGDGLPLPSPLLMIRVVGHADGDAFQAHGRACAETVQGLVEDQGRELGATGSMLDFGCGCGRVLRQWAGLDGVRVVGTDYNPELVDWCRENLPFAEVRRNGAAPPLPAGDSEFGLIYAFSVFTHLGETAQRRLDEGAGAGARAGRAASLHRQGRRARSAPAGRAICCPATAPAISSRPRPRPREPTCAPPSRPGSGSNAGCSEISSS